MKAAFIAAILFSLPAMANDDLILNGKTELNLNRAISIQVVKELPDIEGCGKSESYACAVNAFGKGRCIIYIKPDKLEFLYHELQHCGGERHD